MKAENLQDKFTHSSALYRVAQKK